MAFTDPEKVDIRRFCGFPVFGAQPVQAFGWRFFQAYGTLEFRLNNMSAAEEAVIRTTYLPNLQTMEQALAGAGANLDTAKAAVWERNKNEVRDREALLLSWQRKLCQFIGVPPGPYMDQGGVEIIV